MELYIKALHIIFVITWFAGLFYIVRLFIYHVEALEKEEPERSILTAQYQIMEGRLWNIITQPSAVLTFFLAFYLMHLYGWLDPKVLKNLGFMHLKLSLVALLYVYHFYCGYILKKLKTNSFTWSSTKLRMWNEVATLLLFGIVFLIVLKNTQGWLYGLAGLIAFGVVMMLIVKWYKRYRIKKGEV